MISVIIPTYGNRKAFLKKLQHNLTYLKDCEIIIIDDNPDDPLKKYLYPSYADLQTNSQSNQLRGFTLTVHPEGIYTDAVSTARSISGIDRIKLIENKRNMGFGMTVNTGIRHAKGDLIMLLNDDVILHDYSFQKAILHFNKDSKLFAVSFNQKNNNNLSAGHNKIFWQKGIFSHSKASGNNNINGWAEGGSCIIDKRKFEELTGFDDLYSPFYWEDIDLSYRAWKSGYKILFDPSIIVEHHHESTIGSFFSKNYVKTISYRNQILFIWKNINDPILLILHYLFLLPNIVYYTFKGEIEFIKGLFDAIKRIPMIRRNRYKLTDTEILNLFNH